MRESQNYIQIFEEGIGVWVGWYEKCILHENKNYIEILGFKQFHDHYVFIEDDNKFKKGVLNILKKQYTEEAQYSLHIT